MLSWLIFLAVQLPPGLNYIDTVIGAGPPAEKGDIVTIGYRGSLTDGKEFDNNRNRAPLAFELGAELVIEGMEKGLLGMKAGGKRILSIPPELGYGDKEHPRIPPNSTLIYEIEMLRIDKKGKEPKLEIIDIVVGAGKEAAVGDAVELHYTGTFLNGVKFDSSRDRNKPFTAKVGAPGTIKGFADGLIGMKVGGKRKIVIPYQLGYGAAGAGDVIPPFATLVFEIELISIKEGAAQSGQK